MRPSRLLKPETFSALLARLRDVVEAKDTEIALLREQCRLLELKVAELERRLGQDSTTSGMAPSKDPIGAREQREAERAREKKERQVSERERSGGPQARRAARSSGSRPVAGCRSR